MAERKTQKQMDALLSTYQQQGQQLRYSPTYATKEIDNPAWERLDEDDKIAAQFDPNLPQPKIKVQTVAWQGQDALIEAYRDPETGEYTVLHEGLDKPTASEVGATSGVGPEQRAKAEEDAREARRQKLWNESHGPNSINPDTGEKYGASAPGSGLAETHAERTKREYDAQDQAGQAETREANRRAEQRQIEAQRLQAEQQRTANELAQAKFDYDKEKDVRPQMASTPTDATKNIAIWDPASQTVRSVENPMYDAAKAEAARLKDQLSTGIALNQITAQQAAQQYKQWWDTNVELPFKQAAEVRARAAEQRAALEAEDRRKQFASDFSLRKANLGFTAGNAAVQNEMGLLPYRAGPTEAAEMSAAITSLGQGGKIAGPDASAGINFTPGAFEFDRPDFDKIAQKATKNALKGITKYSPEGSFSQGNYEGISMPSGQGAPSSTGGGIDLGSLWQQYLQQGVEPYSGPPEE